MHTMYPFVNMHTLYNDVSISYTPTDKLFFVLLFNNVWNTILPHVLVDLWQYVAIPIIVSTAMVDVYKFPSLATFQFAGSLGGFLTLSQRLPHEWPSFAPGPRAHLAAGVLCGVVLQVPNAHFLSTACSITLPDVVQRRKVPQSCC